METQGLKEVITQARKAVCAAFAIWALTACGGGGGGGGSQAPVDASKYVGVTKYASMTQENAVAFTSDAFAAGSIGSSTNLVGVMVPVSKGTDSTTTVPEIAVQLKASLKKGLQQRLAAPSSLTGVASSETIYGAVGGSASLTLDVQPNGDFTGKMTFDKYQDLTGGPIMSGTMTVSGIYNQTLDDYDSVTVTCSPLTVTTSKGTSSMYGSFAFSLDGTNEVLRVSCTLNVAGRTYWIKDWNYTYSADNHLSITGVYYHPSYGYAYMTTPTRLTVTSLSDYPTAGVFQAAGNNCSKAKLTFSATGSIVTVIAGDNQSEVVCSE